MVHALTEVHRTLRPGGVLIDLRPFTSERQLEVVQGTRIVLAGDFDVISVDEDDLAADAAVESAIKSGLFGLERAEEFEIAYHWESVDEMAAFVEARWSSASLPPAVEQKARDILSAGPGSLRSFTSMSIKRLVKMG